jgi:curved DNA-binding protein
MPVEFKDYYAALGVPREATDEEIKKAFRKLAREFHPDVAKDKQRAEEKFKEINEAYEVLSDPQKRRKYDQLGARWKEGAPFESPPGWTGEAGPPPGGRAYEFHFGGTGFSDFFEQFFSGGSRYGFPFPPEGEARAGPSPAYRGSDIEGDILVTLDEVKHGAVRQISLQHVNPATRQTETHRFRVRIPPGVQEGQAIRVAGKGEEGQQGGEPGDLYLRVRYAAHPDFRARGADLYFELDLAPWEAVLGCTVSAPSLDAPVTLRIPPRTNNGQQLRVRGKGLPTGRDGGHGDLYVVVNVQLPPHLTEEERALWEKLSQVSTFTPRGGG